MRRIRVRRCARKGHDVRGCHVRSKDLDVDVVVVVVVGVEPVCLFQSGYLLSKQIRRAISSSCYRSEDVVKACR
jgi:hypothetical protein